MSTLVANPQIMVDDRESRGDSIKELERLGARLEFKRLEVGDFVLSDQCAVERKTRTDFESSVVDGRLFEQAHNLVGQYPRSILIIVGERFERLTQAALRGALLHLALEVRLPVLFVRDEAAFARTIFHAAQREQSEGREVRLRSEKRAFTQGQRQQFIIEGLPGVGPELAQRLLERFGRVENVLTATEDELCSVDGVGEQTAQDIREVLGSRYRRADGDRAKP